MFCTHFLSLATYQLLCTPFGVFPHRNITFPSTYVTDTPTLSIHPAIYQPIHSLTPQHTQLSALLHFKQPSISSVSFRYCSHLSLSFSSSPRPPLMLCPLRTFPLNKFVPGFLLTGSSACGLSSSGVFRDMIWTSNSNFH